MKNKPPFRDTCYRIEGYVDRTDIWQVVGFSLCLKSAREHLKKRREESDVKFRLVRETVTRRVVR
jgi:hypothetical protein